MPSQSDRPPGSPPSGTRRTLFRRYFLSLFVAMVVPVALGGISEAWFGYRDQRAGLDELLQAEARLAADRIQVFLDGIRGALAWSVQLPWVEGQDQQRRLDALRMLRQAPAITTLTLVDGAGRERVTVSRIGLNRTGRGADLSATAPVAEARNGGAWYGPVTFEQASEPYMTMAVAGNRAAAGIAVADINLKLVWDVVNTIRIGQTGYVFVLDRQGRLLAHPDLSLVLRGETAAAGFEPLRAKMAAEGGLPVTTTDPEGRRVVALSFPISGAEWMVGVLQPLAEAYAPIRAAAWRAAALILLGTLLALLLAYGLARRMAEPIRALETGVRRIGAGQFDHRIRLATGDELEGLAERVNAMAAELAASQEKTERIARLRRFLAPQVAELVEHAGDAHMLDGQRREVVAVFGDLRGFTAFAAHAAPEVVMDVIDAYYGALGAVVTRHGATLTNFSGDGFMLLVNAPIACPEPGATALRLAIEMQDAVQRLILDWRRHGHAIGFGIGLAMGPATVGRIGYADRMDYTAIGNAVNLAARLCAAAADRQILCDEASAQAAAGLVGLTALGSMAIRGFEQAVAVFALTVPPPVEGAPPVKAM